MKTFDTFWTELNSNPSWVEWMERINKAGFKKAAETAYGNLIADPLAFDKYTVEESRKYVGNILKKMPVDTRPFVPSVAETEKKEVVHEPTTPERRERWLKVLAWRNRKLTEKKVPVSSREIISNGQWEPAKELPHSNGIDLKLLKLKETIKKFGRRKYKNVYSFTGFSTYKFGLVEVFAASEEDAKAILKKAERYCKFVKVF